jgi:integrase
VFQPKDAAQHGRRFVFAADVLKPAKTTQLTYPTYSSDHRSSETVLRHTTHTPLIKLRDGEVVLYRRSGINKWHCRYKLPDYGWIRRSTNTANIEDATRRACDWYDEARFRQRMGLAPELRTFAEIAALAVKEMRRDIAAGTAKRVFADYCAVTERYLIPFFGRKHVASIAYADITEFEAWRNTQMGRRPATSTLLTFASAWSRITDLAIERGWLSAHTPVPKLSVTGGIKSKSRPAFTAEEVQRLREFMRGWVVYEGRNKNVEMRLLLRDYVELLVLTGIRHGTEAMRIRWRHCEWHRDGSARYLRIWVSGKTGERWLIAKNDAVSVLERLCQRDAVCAGKTLDAVFAARVDKLLFTFSDGTQPYHFNAAFSRLLGDCGLERDGTGAKRTLYSLRHTYATLELLTGTDIHTLARQMGTSVLMLERFYSKVNATKAAERLA